VAHPTNVAINAPVRAPVPDGEIDDAELAVAAKQDRAAFAPLYRRYADPVYRYCLRRLRDREDAEDATTQVFTNALAALPRYRDDGRSFRSWLFAIAHNVLVDAERKRRPSHALEVAAAIVDHTPGPEEEALAAEARRDVRALLDAVTPDQRRVLELRLAGLSTAEIGRVLGRPPAAIRGIQLRAEIRLRSLLGVAPSERGTGDA
jgi:RNA polymerase sigma-70 factor (ECF subfamily)